MGTIKPKIGRCPDCGADSRERALIAGRCSYHYAMHRHKINSSKPSAKAKQVQQKVKGAYFATQVMKMPLLCEESGQVLPKSPAFMRLACCAHILAKREVGGFPSVATHPQNMIFLHPDIHSNMDNLGADYTKKMKSLPIMRERVAQLLPFLTAEERRRVPEYFL